MGTRQRPSFEDLGTEVVIFEVGETKQQHTIHKKLLTKESPYFRAMFEGQWKEATSSEPIALPTAREKPFGRFVEWLYFGISIYYPFTLPKDGKCLQCGDVCKTSVPAQPDKVGPVANELTEDEEVEVEGIIESLLNSRHSLGLYIFADEFDIPGLRREIIDATWRACCRRIKMVLYKNVIVCYRHLPETSPMRRLLLHTAIQTWDEFEERKCPWLSKLRMTCSTSFWLTIALTSRGKVPFSSVFGVRPLCHYHEHAQDKDTCSQCFNEMEDEAKTIRRCHKSWKDLDKDRKRKRKSDD